MVSTAFSGSASVVDFRTANDAWLQQFVMLSMALLDWNVAIMELNNNIEEKGNGYHRQLHSFCLTRFFMTWYWMFFKLPYHNFVNLFYMSIAVKLRVQIPQFWNYSAGWEFRLNCNCIIIISIMIWSF
jgi:hypothetical protein